MTIGNCRILLSRCQLSISRCPVPRSDRAHDDATYVDDDRAVEPPRHPRPRVAADLHHELGRFTLFRLDHLRKQVEHRCLHVRYVFLRSNLSPVTTSASHLFTVHCIYDTTKTAYKSTISVRVPGIYWLMLYM